MRPIFPDIYSNMRTSGSEGDVDPLDLTTRDGVPYRRRPAVEAECREVLLLPESEWLRGRKTYRPETLVHLIQKTLLGPPQVYADLLAEIAERIVHLARKGVRGLDPLTAEHIVDTVRVEILRRVLTDNGFLEVSFAGAVAGCLIDALKVYKNTMPGDRDYLFEDAVDEDGDRIERPMELLLSHYPSPEEAVIALRQQEQRRALLDKAASKVKDPRHLEAVVLRVVEDTPITSDDPEKDSLTKHFNATVDQIKHWLKAGLQALRRALQEMGVQGVTE